MEKKDTLQAKEERKEQRKRGLKHAKLRLFVMAMAVMSALSVNAFASAGETLDTVSDTITVTALLTETGMFAKSGMKIVWALIVSNPVLEVTIGVGLLTLIFAIWRRAKRAAHF